MVIQKILNNNVIVTEDEEGREIVAMGRGLAFGKRAGDCAPEDKVEKVYRLSSPDMQEHFQKLLTELKPEYLALSTRFIEQAEEELGTKLHESIYVVLTDHIHMAVKRLREGIPIRNMMLWEIRRFYPREFALGLAGAKLMGEEFHVEVPEDEAGFLALHLVDGQMELQYPIAERILTLVEDIVNIVRRTTGTELDAASTAYSRFILHLKFFAQRVYQRKDQQGEIDPDMAAMIRMKYARAWGATERIAAFVKKKHGYRITDDERFYLTIHIARLLRDA